MFDEEKKKIHITLVTLPHRTPPGDRATHSKQSAKLVPEGSPGGRSADMDSLAAPYTEIDTTPFRSLDERFNFSFSSRLFPQGVIPRYEAPLDAGAPSRALDDSLPPDAAHHEAARACNFTLEADPFASGAGLDPSYALGRCDGPWDFVNASLWSANASSPPSAPPSSPAWNQTQLPPALNLSDVWDGGPLEGGTLGSDWAGEGVQGEWGPGLLAVTGLALYTLALCTAVGNALVIHAIRTERRLQTVSNLFIMSLAAADLTVGVIVMPISAAYAMMGDWRLGLAVCQFWLSADYTASTASIFNLVILSLDRYWSITAPLRYLRRRTRRRALVMIGASWAAAMAWLLPVLAWHHLTTGGERLHPPHVCETEFSNSAAFKAVTAALNFYLPTALMLYLYCRIFKEIKTRQALGRVNFSNHDLPTDSCSEAEKGPRPRSRSAGRSPRAHASSSSPRRSGDRAAAAAASASAPAAEGPRSHFQSLTVVSPGRHDCSHFSGVTVSVEYLPDDADPDSPAAARRSYSGRHLALQQQQEAAEEEEDAYQYQRRQGGGGARLGPHHNHIHCYQSSSRPHPSWHPSPPAAGTWGGAGGRGNNARHPFDAAHAPGSARNATAASNGTRKRATVKGRGGGAGSAAGGRRAETVNLAKERKAARQLGVIVGCFMMCWVPYFTLFPIMALCETCVPAHAHTATIWLGYLNSALNPVLYPLCNHNFRRAFARMLRLPSRPRNNHCPQRVATITIRH